MGWAQLGGGRCPLLHVEFLNKVLHVFVTEEMAKLNYKTWYIFCAVFVNR